MKSIVLIGGGGHCRSCIDVVEEEGKHRIVGIVDLETKNQTSLFGYKVIGSDNDLPKLVGNYDNVLITVGQIKSADLRVKLFKILSQMGANLPTVSSPKAFVSKHSTLKAGTILMHGAILNAGSSVGENCIINSQALIEHDAVVESHCHISTGAKINGGAFIGKDSFVGSGSVIHEGILIGEKCVIAAGSIIRKSIPSGTFYVIAS